MMITVAVAGGDGGLFQRLATWATAKAADMLVTETSVDVLVAGTVDRPDVVLLDVIDRAGADPVGDVRRLRAAGLSPLAVTRHAGARFSAELLATGACVLVGEEQDPAGLATAIRTAAAGACPPGNRNGSPSLSRREETVLRAYVSGLKLDTVARRMGISPSTAKTYLERVKAKYRQAGRPADTKLELARRLAEESTQSR
jgi:two-component system, NarL family, nitrate/nitrite response regulator NarL